MSKQDRFNFKVSFNHYYIHLMSCIRGQAG